MESRLASDEGHRHPARPTYGDGRTPEDATNRRRRRATGVRPHDITDPVERACLIEPCTTRTFHVRWMAQRCHFRRSSKTRATRLRARRPSVASINRHPDSRGVSDGGARRQARKAAGNLRSQTRLPRVTVNRQSNLVNCAFRGKHTARELPLHGPRTRLGSSALMPTTWSGRRLAGAR